MRCRRALIGAALLIALAACGDTPPASVPVPVPPPLPAIDDTVVARLRIEAPQVLLVNESQLIRVFGYNAAGYPVDISHRLRVSSDRPGVLSLSGDLVLTGLRRGSVTMSFDADNAEAQLTIAVQARVKILPDRFRSLNYGYWPLFIGDTVQFSARYVDIDGELLSEMPQVTWSSSDPTAASVSATGRVAALHGPTNIVVTGTTPDGSAVTGPIAVLDELAGQPATIRYAHTVRGIGPITFTPNKGEPVTLSYGQSVERPVGSGYFQVTTTGLPPSSDLYLAYTDFAWLIRRDEHVAVYAVGDQAHGYVAPVWYRPVDLYADSSVVRLVQGSDHFGVVYVRNTGGEANGLPELCYFDPTNVSTFYRRPGGGFDLILSTKYGAPETLRLPVSAPVGRATTLVLTGWSKENLGVLAFTDQ